MSGQKYASLPQRREAMTPQDRKEVSEKAWILTAFVVPIGGVFLYIGVSNLIESLQEFNALKAGATFAYGKLIFSLLFILMPLSMFYYVYRAWHAMRLQQKIVYTGKVTGIYRKSRSSNRYATLNGVEFLIDWEDWDVIAQGDLAEFHCSQPGDVFHIRKISEAELKDTDQTTTERQVSVFKQKSAQTAKSKLVKVGIFAAIFLCMQIYTCYTSWQKSYPPLKLFTQGRAVDAEVVQSLIILRERNTKPKREYYLPQVRIDLAENRVSANESQNTEDDEDTPQQPRGFELLALEENPPEFSSAADAQQSLKAFPVGKKLTVYTIDAQRGPFYAQRIFTSSLGGLVTRLVFDLVFMIVLVLAWRRWSKQASPS